MTVPSSIELIDAFLEVSERKHDDYGQEHPRQYDTIVARCSTGIEGAAKDDTQLTSFTSTAMNLKLFRQIVFLHPSDVGVACLWSIY
jgi:hypothetical protein